MKYLFRTSDQTRYMFPWWQLLFLSIYYTNFFSLLFWHNLFYFFLLFFLPCPRYLGWTCPRIHFSWREEQADCVIYEQAVLFMKTCSCYCSMCYFLTSEAGSLCVEHELPAVFKRKSPPSTWHTGTFLLSCFPTSFCGCTDSTKHVLHLWKSIFLSVCHIWGLLFCLPSASGKLPAPLRDLWGWAVATGSFLALPLCLPTVLTFLPVMHTRYS